MFKARLTNPGLVEIFIVIYLPSKEDFLRLKFKEKKFVIHNLIGPQFCDKSSFSGESIAIKIYANKGLAESGFDQLGPGLTRLPIREQWANFDRPGDVKVAFLIYCRSNLNFHARFF